VRQKQAKGLGHAVLCAESWIGGECFGVVLADELSIGSTPAMVQLRRLFEQTGDSVIGLARVSMEQTSMYCIVEAVDENGLLRMKGMVEKPSPENAPSDLAIVGRYIFFSPALFGNLRDMKAGAMGEIQLTDAINQLAKHEPVYVPILEGERFDTGNPLGFLKANIAVGLRHKKFGTELAAFIKQLPG